jgi:hypothetical protein
VHQTRLRVLVTLVLPLGLKMYSINSSLILFYSVQVICIAIISFACSISSGDRNLGLFFLICHGSIIFLSTFSFTIPFYLLMKSTNNFSKTIPISCVVFGVAFPCLFLLYTFKIENNFIKSFLFCFLVSSLVNIFFRLIKQNLMVKI